MLETDAGSNGLIAACSCRLFMAALLAHAKKDCKGACAINLARVESPHRNEQEKGDEQRDESG